MRGAAAALALAAAIVGACAGRPDAADSARAAAPASSAGARPLADASGAGGAPACPHDGRWRPCSVAERLEQAGLAPRPDTAARAPVPFLSAPDTSFRLGLGSVRAFVYADTARLTRDLAAMDTGLVAPRGGRFTWPVPPTFVRSGNLVAVVLVTNERQLERVQLALEGGPPQRNPDRP